MFKKALDVFSLSNKGPNAIEASADCLYNLGLCYMDEGNLLMVFSVFRNIGYLWFQKVLALNSISEGYLCSEWLNQRLL